MSKTGRHEEHYSFSHISVEQNCGLKELRGDECGQSQVGRALTGEVESGVGARLAVMMAEEGAGMAWAQARGRQCGGTFQGLTALWANDHFPRWRRNA